MGRAAPEGHPSVGELVFLLREHLYSEKGIACPHGPHSKSYPCRSGECEGGGWAYGGGGPRLSPDPLPMSPQMGSPSWEVESSGGTTQGSAGMPPATIALHVPASSSTQTQCLWTPQTHRPGLPNPAGLGPSGLHGPPWAPSPQGLRAVAAGGLSEAPFPVQCCWVHWSVLAIFSLFQLMAHII